MDIVFMSVPHHWGRYFSLASDGISQGDSNCKNGPFKKDSYRFCDKPCILLNVTYEHENQTHILGIMRDCSSSYFREPTIKGEKSCTKHFRTIHHRTSTEEFCFCIGEKCNVHEEIPVVTKRDFLSQLKSGLKPPPNNCGFLYSSLLYWELLLLYLAYAISWINSYSFWG
uniref:Protein quiver n=1 Tax=Syphacia muris TaxID=451379 RepID=A0A0N5A8I7_9BILA